jgi:hypothetical protein
VDVPTAVVIKWVDADDDTITMGSDEELTEAIAGICWDEYVHPPSATSNASSSPRSGRGSALHRAPVLLQCRRHFIFILVGAVVWSHAHIVAGASRCATLRPPRPNARTHTHTRTAPSRNGASAGRTGHCFGCSSSTPPTAWS